MAKIGYKEAKQMLSQACDQYLTHNTKKLNHLLAISGYQPSFVFFQETLAKDKPDPGFSDWVICER